MIQRSSAFEQSLAAFRQSLPRLAHTLVWLIAQQRQEPAFTKAYDEFAAYWRSHFDSSLSQAVLDAHLVQVLLLDRLVKAAFPGIETYNPKVQITEKVLRAFPSGRQVIQSLDSFYLCIEQELQAVSHAGGTQQSIVNAVCEMLFRHFDVHRVALLSCMYARARDSYSGDLEALYE